MVRISFFPPSSLLLTQLSLKTFGKFNKIIFISSCSSAITFDLSTFNSLHKKNLRGWRVNFSSRWNELRWMRIYFSIVIHFRIAFNNKLLFISLQRMGKKSMKSSLTNFTYFHTQHKFIVLSIRLLKFLPLFFAALFYQMEISFYFQHQ
jgi:hypothetical protein